MGKNSKDEYIHTDNLLLFVHQQTSVHILNRLPVWNDTSHIHRFDSEQAQQFRLLPENGEWIHQPWL